MPKRSSILSFRRGVHGVGESIRKSVGEACLADRLLGGHSPGKGSLPCAGMLARQKKDTREVTYRR